MGNAGKPDTYDGKGKRLYIVTYGCQMNVRDSEVICGILEKKGYEFAKEYKSADIVILNTCSVRQHAEDKVWSEIGRYSKSHKVTCLSGGQACLSGRQAKSQSHKPIIGIVGCMAQNYKEEIFQRAPGVDFVVGTADIAKIPEILERTIKRQGHSQKNGDSPCLFETKIWETDGNARPEEIYHTGFHQEREHAYVVISEGCSNFCSYCLVPYVRGKLHNRDHGDIIREIEEAVDSGITSITLLGQNVNAYVSNAKGKTKNEKLELKTQNEINFIDLLQMVNGIKGLREFSFITSHPKDTSAELFDAIAGLDKLKKSLHLPVQSGSDRILTLMKRGYTRRSYLDLIERYRKLVDKATLTTDIIVGFPGETEEDFQETCDLLKNVAFDAAYIFKYSPRPNTAAAKFPDDIELKEKERRHRLILELQKKISREKIC